MIRAAGPLGRYITYEPAADPKKKQPGRFRLLGGEANAQTLLRRVVWDRVDDEQADEVLLVQAAARMFPHPLLKAANRRRAAAVSRLHERSFAVCSFEVKVIGRMVIGIGDENPHENSLRLHGTYGTPILPGQALKGVTRVIAKESGDAEAEVLALGGPAQGAVLFLDALPLPGGHAAPEVLTPHGEEWAPPIPITFLTLTNATFQVHLVGFGRYGEVATDYAKEWLATALQDVGVGAKTASGYGYMKVAEAEG